MAISTHFWLIENSLPQVKVEPTTFQLHAACSNRYIIYTYSLTHCGFWRHMVTEIWVNIGQGNGLLPDDTKLLPEPLLTDHQWSPVTFIYGYFQRCINHQSLKIDLKITCLKFHSHFPGANELSPPAVLILNTPWNIEDKCLLHHWFQTPSQLLHFYGISMSIEWIN